MQNKSALIPQERRYLAVEPPCCCAGRVEEMLRGDEGQQRGTRREGGREGGKGRKGEVMFIAGEPERTPSSLGQHAMTVWSGSLNWFLWGGGEVMAR